MHLDNYIIDLGQIKSTFGAVKQKIIKPDLRHFKIILKKNTKQKNTSLSILKRLICLAKNGKCLGK